jgi:type II secretory pathway pseudopilin PulG
MSVVLGIVAVLAVLVAPALSGIKSAGGTTKAVYDIAGILEDARSYAMANDTYTYVGIAEVNSSVSSTTIPQSPTYSPTIGGRVALAVVASNDGTRGYNALNSSLANPAWAVYTGSGTTYNYNNGSNLTVVRPPQHFDGLHLATTLNGSSFSGATVGTGNMVRPAISNNNYVIGTAGSATAASVTPFDYPLGVAIGSGQYSFKNVINFDPQGAARIQYSTTQTTIPPYIEIGLQQTNGNVLSTRGDIVAIQIEGMTGAVRIYRP